MIEFVSNCHAVGLIENACKELVKKGAARSIKDARVTDFDTSRYIHDNAKKEELQNKDFNVVVYRHYLIHIRSAPIYMPWSADIRFWYDQRVNRAGIKLQAESLMAIAQSLTVINYLQKLNVKLGGDNGNLTLDKVAEALTETLSKVEPNNAEMSFTAKKNISNRR